MGFQVVLGIAVLSLLLYLKHKLDVNAQNKERDQWVGQPKSVLLRTWWAPTGGVVSDGMGGEILIYITGTSSHRRQGVVGTELVQQTDSCHVYIDKKQNIYDMKWQTS